MRLESEEDDWRVSLLILKTIQEVRQEQIKEATNT